MIVGASSTVAGGRGPLRLPRVRPVGTPILDEAWVAWVDQGTMIQPTLARGLAWLDPNESPASWPRAPPVPISGRPWPGAGSPKTPTPASIGNGSSRSPAPRFVSHARIDPTRQRLIIDGSLRVYAGAGSSRLGPALDRPGRPFARALAFQRRLPAPPRDAADRRARPLAARVPQEGPALSASPSRSLSQTEKTIHFHAEYSLDEPVA